MKVILTGATGMVGEGVLRQSLQDPTVDKVLVVTRRPCGVSHPKLEEIVHDEFMDFSPLADRLAGYDACFFCLGVTSVGKTERIYARLTHTLTMRFARMLAELNPQMSFCYVSGYGTDSSESGKTMWARVKGRVENDLAQLGFRSVYAFRPGFIKPMAGTRRTHRAYSVLGWLYPVLRLTAPGFACTLEDLGRSMIQAASQGYESGVLENRDITLLASRGRAETPCPFRPQRLSWAPTPKRPERAALSLFSLGRWEA